MTNPRAIPPVQPTSKRAVGDAYVLFFVSLFLVLTVGLAAQTISIDAGLLLTEILLILLPAVVYVRLKRLPLAEALRWRPVAPGMALRCVVLGVLACPVAVAVGLAVCRLIEPIFGVPPSAEHLVPDTLGGFALRLLAGAVLAGLCEETLFRGAIQATLERNGIWKGVILTAVLFAAYHLNPWNFVPALGLGALLGLLTIRTGSTLSAMICHACVNATAFTFGFIFHRHLEEPWLETVIWLAGGTAAVLFLIALLEFLRRTRGVERRPSPLTAVSARLSRRLKWIAVTVPASLVVLFFVACRLLLGVYRMSSDQLAPEVNRGDRVIVLKRRYVDAEIRVGDVVAFRRDDRSLLRKVVRLEDDCVYAADASSETGTTEARIPRSAVIGKMIYKLGGRRDTSRFEP